MLGTIFYLSNGLCKNVMRAYFLFCLFGWGLGTGNDKQWPWGLGTRGIYTQATQVISYFGAKLQDVENDGVLQSYVFLKNFTKI